MTKSVILCQNDQNASIASIKIIMFVKKSIFATKRNPTPDSVASQFAHVHAGVSVKGAFYVQNFRGRRDRKSRAHGPILLRDPAEWLLGLMEHSN